jgi:hypothetical protein
MAEALRFVARRGEDESSGGGVNPVPRNVERRIAAQHEKQLLVSRGVVLIVLVETTSPAVWPVQAVTPKAVMPRWCRIGR